MDNNNTTNNIVIFVPIIADCISLVLRLCEFSIRASRGRH